MLGDRGLVDAQQGGDLALGAAAEVVEPQVGALAGREALGHRLPHRAHSLPDEPVARFPPLLLTRVLPWLGRAHDRVQVEGVEWDLLVEMVEAGHVKCPAGFSGRAVLGRG